MIDQCTVVDFTVLWMLPAACRWSAPAVVVRQQDTMMWLACLEARVHITRVMAWHGLQDNKLTAAMKAELGSPRLKILGLAPSCR